MSRRSQSKTSRREKTNSDPPPPRRRWPVAVAVISVMMACVSVAWFTNPKPTPPVTADPPPKQVRIPDPDTSTMELPVGQAIRLARSGVLLNPNSTRTWAQYGAVLDAHRLWTDAIPCYRRAGKLDPKDARWDYLLAIAITMEGSGDPGEAAELLREAIRKDPTYVPAYLRLGSLLVEQGQSEGARNAYQQAVDRSPDLAVAHFDLGQVLLDLERVSKAIEHLERAVRLSPKDCLSRGALAQAYRRTGKRELAIRLAESARSLRPRLAMRDPLHRAVQNLCKNAPATRLRLEHFLKKRDYGNAIPALLTYLQTQGNQPYYQILTAQAYLRNGQPQLAGKHLTRALELKGTELTFPSPAAHRMGPVAKIDTVMISFLPAYIEWAIATEDDKILLPLREILERHAATIPPNVAIETTWGDLCRQLNNNSGAKQHYTRAVELDPASPAAELLASLGETADQE